MIDNIHRNLEQVSQIEFQEHPQELPPQSKTDTGFILLLESQLHM